MGSGAGRTRATRRARSIGAPDEAADARQETAQTAVEAVALYRRDQPAGCPAKRQSSDASRSASAMRGVAPRTILGMTLYNNAKHLREAMDSVLGQTHRDFALLMLDDGSSDEIARQYERQDARVRYVRHQRRQGMVPTWKEVVEMARRDHPGAEYFAWV